MINRIGLAQGTTAVVNNTKPQQPKVAFGEMLREAANAQTAPAAAG